ncbi:MAG: hypothetical protein ACKKMV_00720 [Candidatus Nealsonbacteria bacterium]|nr:MAG: hypothetical protein IB617_01170 [Candidatus Nealsonbacteria bacterium]
MQKSIHWWQFPLYLMSIKLNSDFKEKFFEKTKKDFKSVKKLALFLQRKSKLYNKNITTDYRIVWQYHKKAKYIPAWAIYEISKKIKVTLLEVERNIQGYVSTYGRLYIFRPQLPIKITPEFTSIAIHMMCDGCINRNNFIYYQKEESGLKRFEKITSNVFGKYRIKKYKRAHYFPAIFSVIVTNYFNIPTYLSAKCRIPPKVLKGDKENKIATLLAFLHDDGNVSGSVRFLSSNKKFIMDLRNIVESLGYKCSISTFKWRGKMTREHYSLLLSYESVEKFFQGCNELIFKYPNLGIGRKLNEIGNIIKFKHRSWKQRKKFETKRIILNALKAESKTAFELREIANINLWTVYHHLQMLMKQNKVKKYKKGSRFKYQLIPQ